MEFILRKNNVRVAGDTGPALVFGHGFGTDQRAWRFVAPAFATGRRQVFFDHLGFGGSDRHAYDERRHGTLEGYARDLLDILDALDLRQVTYVGHSAGGMIGLLASVEQPQRFERLALIGTSPRFIDEPPDYVGGFSAEQIESILDLVERDQLGWADTLAPLAIGEQGTPELVRDFGASLAALDPLIARRFGRLVFTGDWRAPLARSSVPALILQCLHDSIVPAAVGRYLHGRLAGSVLVELDASGHCPHLSHPEATIAALRPHLDGARPHG